MIIQTERLLLRPFCNEDKSWYCNLVKDEEVKRRLPGLEVKDDNEVNLHIEIFKKCDFINDFYYVIIDKENRVVGLIIGVRITSKTIDVSYFLYNEYRKNGYMTEALKNFIKTIKAQVDNYIFKFAIEEDNEESMRVVKKLTSSIEQIGDKYICYA